MRYADLAALYEVYFANKPIPSDLVAAIDTVYVRHMVELAMAKQAERAAPLDAGAREILVGMLAERFSYIRHTYLLYTTNTASLMNQFCLTLARGLQAVTGKNRFQLLMPSILSTESALTGTDLNDDDVAVTDFILSDKQKDFIEVAEALRIAENDGKLRHTQRLGGNGKEVLLSAAEKNRLLAHSQEAADYYQAIKSRHDFIHNGTTLGSLFQQLVEGMEQGDAAHQGQELNAGNSASEAILRFAEVYRTLSNEQRKWLNGLRASDHTFKHYWDILTVKQEEKIREILADKTLTNNERTERLNNVHLSLATCMQINSGKMSAILHANKSALFGVVIKHGAIQQAGMAHYDEAIANARHWFVTRMINLRTGRDALAPVLTDETRQQCATKFANWIRQQALGGNASLLQALKPLAEQDSCAQVVAGGRHTLFLTARGGVYACGNNESGQLGLGDGRCRSRPRKIISLPVMAQVVAGGNHSFFLTAAGEVYACGGNEFGQLGLGDRRKRSRPEKIRSLPVIAQVVAACSHTLFLTARGEVYACGDNMLGQLGLGDERNRQHPEQIPSLPAISQIVAGGFYSLFLTARGEVYACGGNYNGQLGLGDGIDRQHPEQIPSLPAISQVVAGCSHTLFLTARGEVYACGGNYNGQLGLGGRINRQSPEQIPSLPPISQIVAGGFYSLFLTAAGEVYACGVNGSGQLGLGDERNRLRPAKILSLPAISQIVAGGFYSLFLTAAGEVYACGVNGSGQLGLGEDGGNRLRPTLVSADFLNPYPVLRETLISATPSLASGSAGLFALPAAPVPEAQASDVRRRSKRNRSASR